MGKMRENWRWRIVLITTGFLFTFGVVVFSYIHKFDNVLAEENEKHLSEISNHIALHMMTAVHDTQEALKTASAAVAALDTKEARMDYLRKVAAQYSFAYIGYAGADGRLHATVDSEAVDIRGEAYFQNALKGEGTATDLTRKIFYDHAVTGVIFAVPLGGEPQAGVVVAMLDIARIADEHSLDNFGGREYSYIIDKKGELILQNKSLDFNNLFKMWSWVEFKNGNTLEKVLEDIKQQRKGVALYSSLGVEKYAYYRPLGINAWTIVNVVPKEAIAGKTTGLTRELAAIGFAMVLVFVALVFIALISYGVSQSRRQAIEEKSAFLANMSHEIRTPMNAIVGISEILLREGLTLQQRDMVLSIANSGRGLLTIINDILDISKIEAGRFTMTDEPYELESLLYDVTAVIAIRMGEKPVELLIDPAPSLPRALIGDMSRVKQLLLNVIGNAVKFTMKGYIRVKLDYAEMDGGILLRMAVIDTGIGIKPEDIGRLFISFNQVDTHRNRNVEGTGLGLAISKNLCELMGGGISVESEYGKGSTFTLSVFQGVADRAPLIARPPENVRILVCEPSPVLREYEFSCMKKLGAAFEICSTRQEFEGRLAAGAFTHALAGRAILQGLTVKGDVPVQFLRLLNIREHSFVGQGNVDVYLPLFLTQLAFVLRGGGENRVMKNVGVDMKMIEVMPHVRILIVDDNEVNLQVALGLMRPYRMQVDCVLSGQEAVEAVQRGAYDLIFMDHMMPGMDGIETAEKIRSLPDEKYGKIPIIVLTANATQEAQELFAKAEFDGFLSKPIETAKLDAILKKWLKRLNEERGGDTPGTLLEEIQGKDETPGWFWNFEDAEIDFRTGIKKIGSLSTYVGILHTYHRSTAEKLAMLPEWVENDKERFVIEVHGIKSASAAIAAPAMSALAEELERMGKAGNYGEVKVTLLNFLRRGERVLAEIQEFLIRIDEFVPPQHSAAAGQLSPPGRMTMELLDELESAFLDFDTERLQNLLAGEIGAGAAEKELVKNLRDCYREYEFDVPVRLIREYKKKFGKEG